MFDLKTASDLVILALVLWREARGEPRAVKAAVACSVLNRVDRPCWWGSDITTVVTRRLQYSSMTDPHDPQLVTWPINSMASWLECLQVAEEAILGRARTPYPHADSYHDVSINPPKWATPEVFCGKLGRILFYNVDRDTEAKALERLAA